MDQLNQQIKKCKYNELFKNTKTNRDINLTFCFSNTLIDQKCSQELHDCLHGKTKDVPDEMFSRRLINMLLGLAVFEVINFVLNNVIL